MRGSSLTTLKGTSSGGPAFTHVGDEDNTFVVLWMRPGLAAVAALKLESATYTVELAVGSRAMLSIACAGSSLLGSRLTHVLPRSRVSRVSPWLVP